MPPQSTLKDIASELGISITTVSRALAGYSDVAESTRRRIEAAAARLNYIPNTAGQALKTGRSRFVALLLPLHDDRAIEPFLGEFIGGLAQGLLDKKRDLYLAAAPEALSEMSVLERIVDSGRADGVVLTRVLEDDERVGFLADRKFPFITHGRVLDTHQRYSWVDTDGAIAFTQAFDTLYALGHRRFGLCSIDEPMTFRLTRESGLEQAIADQGDTRLSLVRCSSSRFDADARQRALEALLSEPERPTAMLALTDEIAFAVIETAGRLGLRVPDDLSVIGFDNVPAAAWVPPGLSTFDQRTRETTIELAHTLVDIIEGHTAEQHRLLRPHFIARGSHGPVPITTTTRRETASTSTTRQDNPL